MTSERSLSQCRFYLARYIEWSIKFQVSIALKKVGLPPDEAETIDDFLESLIEDNGRLSLRLLRSRNPPVASNNFLGIRSCPKVSSISSSDMILFVVETSFSHVEVAHCKQVAQEANFVYVVICI